MAEQYFDDVLLQSFYNRLSTPSILSVPLEPVTHAYPLQPFEGFLVLIIRKTGYIQ